MGLIDDINELFGGVELSGFVDLAQYDDIANGGNGDGKIDTADLIWSELKVWQDFDQDGISDEGELSSLEALGIVSLNLDNTPLGIVTPQGATLRVEGTFTWDNGDIGRTVEAIFELNNVDTKYRGEAGRAPWLDGVNIDCQRVWPDH